ncbi:MAG: succinate dehydrogenase, cytochrome b556 subunit [Actinomycetota bacterium]
MATRLGKKGSDLGTMYRGRTGQWAWIAHRITGVGLIFFLFAHIVDTAMIGWGPEAYDRVTSVYHNPVVRLVELGLVGFVIFHAFNGLRIITIDFWPKAARYERPLFLGTMTIVVLMLAPIAYIMTKQAIELFD